MKLRAVKAAACFCGFIYCCVSYFAQEDSSEKLYRHNERVSADFRISAIGSRRITSLQENSDYLLDVNTDLPRDSKNFMQGKTNTDESKNHQEIVDFSRVVTLQDIFISVKTSGKFHRTRLQVILDTWFSKARPQTYFFTDTDDLEYQQLTGGHLVNTGCSESHTRHDLTCKMGAEYDAFTSSKKKWWCHFDDDNYVNTYQLVKMLLNYDWRDDVYIGRASLNHPFHSIYNNTKVDFWFATGGAGLCVSAALAAKMAPWCSNGKLVETSSQLRAPDDCTLGFVINNRLGVKLTQSNLLHSHLELLHELPLHSLKDQVSMSYRINGEPKNRISLTQPFDDVQDPTRFLSLHCMLEPTAQMCKMTT